MSVGPGGERLEHLPDLPDPARRRAYGAFAFVGGAPEEIVAGTPTTFDLRYRAGDRGLPVGAAVALLWRLPADWGVPPWNHHLLAVTTVAWRTVTAGSEAGLLLDGRLTCERARDASAPRAVEAILQPPAAPPGRHAYWVEVVQVDGARAWSSPHFVTIAPDADARRPAPDPTPRPAGRSPEAR